MASWRESLQHATVHEVRREYARLRTLIEVCDPTDRRHVARDAYCVLTVGFLKSNHNEDDARTKAREIVEELLSALPLPPDSVQ